MAEPFFFTDSPAEPVTPTAEIWTTDEGKTFHIKAWRALTREEVVEFAEMCLSRLRLSQPC